MTASFDRGSFRDPASRVQIDGSRVIRILSERGLADWETVRASKLFASDRVIGSTETTVDGSPALEHPRIRFWSYPYEWSFTMLRQAALLQLELLEEALTEDLTIKDATPYNIQFQGTRPIFVDIGSFRPLEPGEPWLAYRQFCQMFLYPLLVNSYADVPFQPLLRSSLDGISPAMARTMLSGHRRRPGVLTDVGLQARADRSVKSRDMRTELSQAGFKKELIVHNVRRLRKIVLKTEWDPDRSTWSDYAHCDHVATQRSAKETFIRQVAGERRRNLIWDLGANDGHFSIAAADHADLVVAMDGDALVIDRLFRRLSESGPGNVLPLVVDLSSPSPAWGWRGAERTRLEDRGRPDLIFLLAVVHHLVIAANIPLTEVIDWLAWLGGEVVFEWVPPTDPMARKLAVNKKDWEIHPDYREEVCRTEIDRRFTVAREQPLEGRILFHLIPKG